MLSVGLVSIWLTVTPLRPAFVSAVWSALALARIPLESVVTVESTAPWLATSIVAVTRTEAAAKLRVTALAATPASAAMAPLIWSCLVWS